MARSSSAADTVTRKARTAQPRMSFIRSRSERSRSLRLGHGQGPGELLEQLPLLGAELGGHHHAHGTWRSPRPLPPEVGNALVRASRKIVPGCVPSGT